MSYKDFPCEGRYFILQFMTEKKAHDTIILINNEKRDNVALLSYICNEVSHKKYALPNEDGAIAPKGEENVHEYWQARNPLPGSVGSGPDSNAA